MEISMQVEVEVVRPSVRYAITLVAVGYAMSLGSALATIYTAYSVLAGRAGRPRSDRLVGPLTVVATIITIRTTFPLTPDLGTTLGKCYGITSCVALPAHLRIPRLLALLCVNTAS